MGVKRFVKRWVLREWPVDAVKNIKEEGSLIGGVKRTFKEDITEDFPLTRVIYESGRYDGEKEGYAQASDTYEEKLIQQGTEFDEQIKAYKKEQAEYNDLLNECEEEINKLTNKINRTEHENVRLQQLLLREQELKKL